MPTEIISEEIEELRDIFEAVTVKGKCGKKHVEIQFKKGVDQTIIDRVSTYDMVKDKYTREWLSNYLQRFTGITSAGYYTFEELENIHNSIVTDFTGYSEFVDLIAWLSADLSRTYYTDEVITYMELDNLEDVLRTAQENEIEAVYDLGFNFVCWYLKVEPEPEDD
jgi:hypothetical protein